ncbi:hypothetical protein [Helcococcus sueciensis]|uniref:hypothetical protein n=1 Tax=Helcococcus sueciensis TaxID=241555 RepID=UPI000420F94E|nr:hypothetical protein [Helcococcus sueciensis]
MKFEQENGEIIETEMTNEIVRMLIKSIIQILKDDNVNSETIKKIESLLNK